MDQFQYNARNGENEEIVRMRFNHYENRRRKKLKIVFDEI